MCLCHILLARSKSQVLPVLMGLYKGMTHWVCHLRYISHLCFGWHGPTPGSQGPGLDYPSGANHQLHTASCPTSDTPDTIASVKTCGQGAMLLAPQHGHTTKPFLLWILPKASIFPYQQVNGSEQNSQIIECVVIIILRDLSGTVLSSLLQKMQDAVISFIFEILPKHSHDH